MEEIILQNKDGQIVASSRDVANRFNKRHTHVLDVIKGLLETNPEYKDDFLKSSYVASNGKRNPYYLLTENGEKIMNAKYSLGSRSSRFETKFGNLLHDLFKRTHVFEQYPILDYRLDFFMPDVHIIIEYDEKYHESEKQFEKDKIREKEILDELNRRVVEGEPMYEDDYACPNPWLKGKNIFTIIRVKQGHEIDGIREICKTITEEVMRPCSDFM